MKIDKVIRLEKFDVPPSDMNSAKQWKLWYRGFKYFLSTLTDRSPDKLEVLFLHIGTNVSDLIEECTNYDAAVKILEDAYVKTPSEIYARHLLATRNQQESEDLDTYLHLLNKLATDCKFKAVTAEKNRDDFVRDSFIRGVKNGFIRTRLLENSTLDLQTAFKQARALEQAQKQSEAYRYPTGSSTSAAAVQIADENSSEMSKFDREKVSDGGATGTNAYPTVAHDVSASLPRYSTAKFQGQKCFNCGNARHEKDNRALCPAQGVTCRKCGKMGHFGKVCRTSSSGNRNQSSFGSRNRDSSSAAVILASMCSSTNSVSSMVDARLNDQPVKAMIDTGSSDNFITESLVRSLNLKQYPKFSKVNMANPDFSTDILGYCDVKICLLGRSYQGIKFSVIPKLCTDVILGEPFLKLHKALHVEFSGTEPALELAADMSCALACAMRIPPARLFSNLSSDCQPVATRSRKFNASDKKFIEDEVQKLLDAGVIEPSDSPWRAQIVLTSDSDSTKKRRMVVDFSRTINKFTVLDAFPLPLIEEIVQEVAKYKFYSVVDLSSAYYQIEIPYEDRHYTAFEAAGGLYQFTRIPMGVTNGVPAFQRIMNNFISEKSLKATVAYVDDVTICGKTQEEHDSNLAKFKKAAEECNLQINEEKSKYSLTTIKLLGYCISEGKIQPDPDRLRALLELPLPVNSKTLQRALGLFAYYAKWVPMYSKKIQPLIGINSFPLSRDATLAFETLKNDIATATKQPIDDFAPFSVETDASDLAIGAVLLQSDRPVAFFSRSLNKAEKHYHIVEKEALAVVESIRYWKHFLVGKHFKLTTDQRAVSFIFDSKFAGKVKNDKILRWRLDLAVFSFDIVYRPGELNVTADALSRTKCGAVNSSSSLVDLHRNLIHPGVQRMLHFVRARNLPYSVDEVRKAISQCSTCAKVKPQYYKKEESPLIKATAHVLTFLPLWMSTLDFHLHFHAKMSLLLL